MSEGLERRSFLKGGLALATALAAGCGSSSGFVSNPPAIDIPSIPPAQLVQPPVLRSSAGNLTTDFNVSYVTGPIPTPLGSRNSKLRTWNGFVGGPTLRVRPGDRLVVNLTNTLPVNTDPIPPDHNTPHHFNTLNLHTHGLHVSPGQDNVLLDLMPGEKFTYAYDIPADHPCGTFWYHAHKHGCTAMHLLSGMAGLLIVEGEVDNDPLVGLATDLDCVISEINLGGIGNETDPNTIYEVPDYVKPSPFASADSYFLVNGQYQPTLTVNPGRTFRLRVLNASARNTMPLSIPGAKLNLISLDGITLPATREVDTVRLAPANRADIIVRFDQAGSFQLKKLAFTGGGGNPTPEAVLMNFTVSGADQGMPLPTTLTTPKSLPDITAAEVTESRTLTYAVSPTGGPLVGGVAAANFTMDGARFSPTVINQTINLNSVIEWTLVNTSGAWHSHHIHINPFQVIATSDGMLNGNPLTQPVWADTVNVPPMGSVTMRQRYPDFPGLFVQHCHVLVHEDIGMMQLVNVV